MKLFKQYLAEVAEHTDGTYAGLYPDENSKKVLADVISKYNIKDPVDVEKMHCTIMFSRTPLAKQGESEGPINIHAIGKRFKLLHGDGTSTTLVLELESRAIENIFKKYIQHGASWDFDEYIPHISLAYNVEEASVPKLTSPIKLTFNQIKIVPLETNWKEKNK